MYIKYSGTQDSYHSEITALIMTSETKNIIFYDNEIKDQF